MHQSLLATTATLDERNEQPRSAIHYKFTGDDQAFRRALGERIDHHFEVTGQSRRDCPRLYLKAAIVLAWFVAAYVLLVFWSPVWWTSVLLAVALGFAMAAIGFNIQHDGGHRAFSARPWVNRLAAMSLDLVGGSSFVWARKHNTIHHSCPNVMGADEDIDIGFFGRLSPYQPRWFFHRWQQFYLWPMYCFVPMKWQLLDDFRHVATAHVGPHRLTRPRGWDLLGFLAGKLVFIGLVFVIPLCFHSLGSVVGCFVLASCTHGILLGSVIQCGHCVEETTFTPGNTTGQLANAWAVHQVEATADFARRSRLVSWFAGGLNFQIEHHLFPQICHVHYPALSAIVEQTCHDFNLPYIAHETFRAGLASHYRWLRTLGVSEVLVPAPTAV